MTKSMQKAIDETNRRRIKQIEHNKEHGITPKGIKKAVADILETGYPGSKNVKRMLKTAEDVVEYASMSDAQIQKEIKQLEKQMYKHAENLEFEEAGSIRDKIHKIQENHLGMAL